MYLHEDVAGQGGQQGEGDDEEHGLVVSWGTVLAWDRSGLVGWLTQSAIAGCVLLQEDVVRSLQIVQGNNNNKTGLHRSSRVCRHCPADVTHHPHFI